MKRFICILLMSGILSMVLPGCQAGNSVKPDKSSEALGGNDSAEFGETEDAGDIEDAEEAGQTPDAEPDTVLDTEEQNTGTEDEPVVMQNLNAAKELFTQTFYKAGDVNCRMQVYADPGEDNDVFRSDTLNLLFTKMSAHFAGIADQDILAVNADAAIKTVPDENMYQAELKLYGYQNGEIVFEAACPVTVNLPSKEDRNSTVSVRCNEVPEEVSEEAFAEIEAIAGEYYPMTESEALFVRYLCRAELCSYPTEVLRLERNTIYAAHGRKFKDEILAEYMEEKPWYRGNTEPEDFSDDVLSDVEKKNILLIQELENQPFDERNGADYSIENFEPAPYLSLLSKNQETGLYAHMEQAEDCGTYYCVPGLLYLPVTFPREQWEKVRDGGQAELCVNELTGETRILEYDRTYGYRFYVKGTVPEDFPSDIRSHYNLDTGLYELQEASDDTIMKPVYEGDLFILKGAVWGGMVSLTTASEIQEEITPDMQSVYANRLYHNGRGYFTAVYSLGD